MSHKLMSAAPAESKAMKEIVVIDPTSRYGKLSVPMSHTFDTKGRTEWIKCNGRLKKDLSICCLFQKGKCHVGERCFQVHVDRTYVTELRKRYANLVTCCHACGDVHSDNDVHRRQLRAHFPTGIVGISFGSNDNVVDIGADRLANTTGLEDMMRGQQRDGVIRRRDGTPVVAFNKVCRLHLKNSCKYGKDCKNLHICYKCADELTRDVEPLSLNTSRCDSRSSTPAITPTTTPAITPVPSAADMGALHYCAAAPDDSLSPTPEMRSRTSTPSWNSPIDSCVVGMSCDNGHTVRGHANVSGESSPVNQDLGFLSRFQSHWPNSGASTESLQIIFGGFPSVI